MTSRKVSPLAQLQGLLTVLDRSKSPPAELLATVREMVGDAIAVMQEPDPLKRSCAFVLAALVEATTVETHVQAGQEHQIVRVTDRGLYTWAMQRAHEIVGKKAA